MSEIKELMEDKWAKPDRKPAVQNRINKLYPFCQSDLETWDSPPKVDASLHQLMRHIALPLEETFSFKYSMEGRADSKLKVFTTAGAACRPAVGLTSISRAVRVWSSNLESSFCSHPEEELLSSSLQGLKLSAVFIAKVAVDLVRFTSCIMTH